MSTVDGWVLEGCSGAVGRNRPVVDQRDWREDLAVPEGLRGPRSIGGTRA
jgi:hypothetical protein